MSLLTRPIVLLTVITLLAILIINPIISNNTYAQISSGDMLSMNFKERMLPNGLKVITLQDNSSPTVAINVWYHVGSKDDPQGRSGFAHLFEHIMFKSTKNMKSEMLDRLTEDVGGYNNAFTSNDMTVYHEVVPSNHLERLLWAEADRLASLNVDDPNFKSERDVVKEEFRQSVLAQPYGKLFLLLDQKSYTAHPYKRPTIGNIEELDAASLEDVISFHKTYYRPDNATLVVVGDFDQKQLDTWVDKYFSLVGKPASAIPRVTIAEPARSSEKRFTEYAENVPLPAVAFTYLTPDAKSDDAYALEVLETILTDGPSSRLYHSLVYEQQLAQEVSTDTDLREDNGLFVFNMTMASGKKPEDGERALLAEIKKVVEVSVTAAELDKARTKRITRQYRERERSEGKALALGFASVILGDTARVNSAIDRITKITTDDVRRVANKYLLDKNRVTIYYLPQAKGSASKETAGDTKQ
ncbi:MAG: M16 family metallopeptidase [Pyrinomonadaceae bacterium]